MKKTRALLLLISLIPLAGCINLSFGSHRSAPPPPAPPPAIVMPSGPITPADTATMAEIDAAARLSTTANRQDALTRIAQRPALTPPVQVHLVNVAYQCLAADHAK